MAEKLSKPMSHSEMLNFFGRWLVFISIPGNSFSIVIIDFGIKTEGAQNSRMVAENLMTFTPFMTGFLYWGFGYSQPPTNEEVDSVWIFEPRVPKLGELWNP